MYIAFPFFLQPEIYGFRPKSKKLNASDANPVNSNGSLFRKVLVSAHKKRYNEKMRSGYFLKSSNS